MSSWRPVINDGLPRSHVLITSNLPLVCVELRSGLGNRLFQIFAGLGYAERTGKQFVLYERVIMENAHGSFKGTRDLLMALFPKVKFFKGIPPVWTHIKEPELGYYDSEPLESKSGSVMLHGYFQNFAHFPSGAKFRVPKPEICKFTDSEINFGDWAFVHVRLGDYVDSQYDIGLGKYYKQGLELLKAAGLTKFLVFSDTPEKINLADYESLCEPGNIRLVSGISVWETLYMMGQCSGCLCANSTFSWFGAFACASSGVLADRIFMPDVWIKNVTGNPVPIWATALPVV